MSDQQAESGPVVPPPASATRKPTAKEVADQALEGVLALQARMDELEGQSATVALADGAPPASLVKAVSDLDRDLSAMTEFVNELAGKVAAPAGPISVDVAPAVDHKLSQHTERIGEALNQRDERIGQEIGSLGRAVDALTSRLGEIDARITEAGEGSPVDAERWNQVARDVEAMFREHREDTQRNLGALVRQINNASTRPEATVELDTIAVPKVYGAMVDVMRLVREVGKNGVGPQEAGRYPYRKLDDAVDAVGSALRSIGLLLVPVEVIAHEIHQTTVTTGNGPRTWTTATVTMRWRYIHPEDGSTQDIVMAGEGRDMGDKATGKANSNAWKNALVQSLNIPVQGMPEVEDDHPVIGGGQGQREPSRTDHMARADQHERQAEQHRREFVREESAPQQPAGGQLTREDAARRASEALKGLGLVPVADRRAKFQAIADYATRQDLLRYEVDGVQLGALVIATGATIPPPEAFNQQAGPLARGPQEAMQRTGQGMLDEAAQVQAQHAAEMARQIAERDPGSTAARVSQEIAGQAREHAAMVHGGRGQGMAAQAAANEPQPQYFPTDDPGHPLTTSRQRGPWEEPGGTGLGTEYPHGYHGAGDFG